MPRYFFNIVDSRVSRDATGTECLDIYDAQAEAVRTAGQMIQEVAENIFDGTDWAMEVTDEHHHVLFIVSIMVQDEIERGPKYSTLIRFS